MRKLSSALVLMCLFVISAGAKRSLISDLKWQSETSRYHSPATR
jgi:hypothetical protein